MLLSLVQRPQELLSGLQGKEGYPGLRSVPALHLPDGLPIELSSGYLRCLTGRVPCSRIGKAANLGKTWATEFHGSADLGTQVGGPLLTPAPLSLAALGLQGSGEVGVVASAINAVVDSSVTNFEVSQD